MFIWFVCIFSKKNNNKKTAYCAMLLKKKLKKIKWVDFSFWIDLSIIKYIIFFDTLKKQQHFLDF